MVPSGSNLLGGNPGTIDAMLSLVMFHGFGLMRAYIGGERTKPDHPLTLD